MGWGWGGVTPAGPREEEEALREEGKGATKSIGLVGGGAIPELMDNPKKKNKKNQETVWESKTEEQNL